MPDTFPVKNQTYVGRFPTLLHADKILYVLRDCATDRTLADVPEYGEPHPDTENWPDFLLVLIKPLEGQPNEAIFFYANERAAQDDDNFNVEFAENNKFPKVTRDYIYLRTAYLKDGQAAIGTADPGVMTNGDPMFPGAILSEGEKVQEGTGDPTIDSLFIAVKRTYEHIPDLSDSADLADAITYGYKVEYPYGVQGYPRLTWKIPCQSQTVQAPLSVTCPITGYTTLVLIEQSYEHKNDAVIARIVVYELNPGPTVVESADEPRTGRPVRITKQIVAQSSVPATAALLDDEINGYTAFGTAITGISSGLATCSSAHGLAAGEEIYFPTLVSPSGDVIVGTANGTGAYYVIASGLTSTQFRFSTLAGGSATTGGATSGTAKKRNLARGTTIEYKAMGMDGLRSIKVTSQIDVAALDYLQGAADTVYWGSHNYRFPDVLNSASWFGAEAFSGGSWAFDIALALNITEGYSGPCNALITERYTSNPANTAFIAGLPAIVKLSPQADSVYAAWAYASGVHAIAVARTFPIPETIHPLITIGASNAAHATSGANQGTIAATSPTAIPSGYFTVSIVPEKWQFGLWVYRIIQIVHPS